MKCYNLLLVSVCLLLICLSHNAFAVTTFEIPDACITIDGNINDWESITPVAVDTVNDEVVDLNGTDIEKVFLAKDKTFLYIMMTLYDGAPKTDGSTLYGFTATSTMSHIVNYGDHGTLANYFENDRWYSSSGKIGGKGIFFYDASFVAVGINFIEWKVPLSDMGDLDGKTVMFMTNSQIQELPSDDINDLAIQLTYSKTDFECEGNPITHYRDFDNDGYGDKNVSTEALPQASGYVFNISDCDDNDSTKYPGATEIYGDGIDQNCDGIDPEMQSTQHLVTEIYVAIFERAPAYSGLMYWTNAVETGTLTIEQVAQSFFDQPETQAQFPQGSSNTEFITAVYYNTLSRRPETAGLAYWVDALDRGLVRRDQAITAIINGAKAVTGSPADTAMLAKKTEIGLLFAISEIGGSTTNVSFMNWARNIISFATSSDFNLEEAEEYIAGLLSSEISCGAYVAPGVWKEFDCYNLAAIGKTTNDDPFTPSWRLIGGYWQWGRKGPDSSQWYDTNTANFAHGPTGPGSEDANSGEISGWDQSYAPNGSWSDASKTANDPCPAGYRVPTRSQWDGVINNNTQSIVGTWTKDNTNYNSARFFGNDLMLPAAGDRNYYSGSLYDRGTNGFYWSSTHSTSNHPWSLNFYGSYAITDSNYHRYGFSVRCVAEDGITYQLYYLDDDGDGYGDPDSSYEDTSQPDGYVTNNTDFDDTDSSIHPGAQEICGDGIDQDCNGSDLVCRTDPGDCGAYVAPGVWKEFDCYNLAAIGKTTNDDPFTPSWRLIGGYWQWGRKGPDSSQWYDTNTANFAQGPTGPGSEDANSGEISGWDQSYAPNGSWSDASKISNDPCPSGYRVPTKSQWRGVTGNNDQSIVGSWNSDDTSYDSARFFGDKLMLPAAGFRRYTTGSLGLRGYFGHYWAATQCTSNTAWNLNFLDSGATTSNCEFRNHGFSVRCIKE